MSGDQNAKLRHGHAWRRAVQGCPKPPLPNRDGRDEQKPEAIQQGERYDNGKRGKRCQTDDKDRLMDRYCYTQRY
jgi:hypothetical protein